MRVLLVADIVGGVRTFTFELARELVSRDVDVELALVGPGGTPDELRGLGLSSCQVRNLRLEWMPEAGGDVERTAEWVEELRRRHRPDVLHMNTFTPVLDHDTPVLLSVHSCVLSWWRAVHGVEAPRDWQPYGVLVKRALARADAVVAPTRALRDELVAVYGPPAARAQVIPNGRMLAASGLRARREPVGRKPAERERLVMCAGRLWDPAKNVGALCAAAPQIRGTVAVAGDGETFPAVQSLGALEQEELLGWLRRAAVFAEPARYEPFGLAALEAGLCGCALVLGDVPTLREVWGAAASYVSPDEPGQLANAINWLLDDPVAGARASAAAAARARRYTPAAMASGYLDAYRQLTRASVAA